MVAGSTPGLVVGELARWGPSARRLVAKREECHCRWRPLCWHAGDQRGWLLERRGFAAAVVAGFAVGMVA